MAFPISTPHVKDMIHRIVVTESEAHQFTSTEACRVEDDDADSGHFTMQWRRLLWPEGFHCGEQADNLGIRKDIRQESRAAEWKLCRVWQQLAEYFSALAKQAQVIHGAKSC